MSEKFEYEYKALNINERREIESIKSQYMKKEPIDEKLEKIRTLDKKVKNLPFIVSLTIGIVGLLLFGLSMTIFLEWIEWWYLGIPCAILGISLIAFAYPIHQKIMKSQKAKYGSMILLLADELLNPDNE